jgi:hypothetical protein
MGDSSPDEIRVLPEKTQKQSSFSNNNPNPARPIRFLINRRRTRKGNSNAAFTQEMETVEEPTSSTPLTNYGYLQHIQSLKPLLTSEDKSLPKKVR